MNYEITLFFLCGHCRLTEQDETCRDQRRSVSMLQVKVNYLEEENKSLLTQRDSLSHQKHNVDRLLKEYQTERSKQVASSLYVPIEHEKLTQCCFNVWL